MNGLESHTDPLSKLLLAGFVLAALLGGAYPSAPRQAAEAAAPAPLAATAAGSRERWAAPGENVVLQRAANQQSAAIRWVF